MEKKPDSQQPELCKNNCYFYGSAMYDNLCSKCFREKQEAERAATVAPATIPALARAKTPTAVVAAADPPSAVGAAAAASAAAVADGPLAPEAAASPPPAAAAAVLHADSAPTSAPRSPLSSAASSASTPARKAQAKKGRCFACHLRVPLVKQTTNRCRCDYVFCDAHRYPDKHSCEFDFKASDRVNLEKHNPKLNERRKGGLSFTRID